MNAQPTSSDDLIYLAGLARRYHEFLEDESGSLFLEELKGLLEAPQRLE